MEHRDRFRDYHTNWHIEPRNGPADGDVEMAACWACAKYSHTGKLFIVYYSAISTTNCVLFLCWHRHAADAMLPGRMLDHPEWMSPEYIAAIVVGRCCTSHSHP